MDTDFVVRGGQSPMPPSGTVFSGSYGKTLEEAAYFGGPINEQHVHSTEGAETTTFSDSFLNPVPKQDRVPGRPKLA